MHSLSELYIQAEDDYISKPLNDKNSTSFLCYGFRIVKQRDSWDVKILNISMGGDFYSEVTYDQYMTFKYLGWKKGIYKLYLLNCREKLSKLETRIQDSMVNNESVKYLRKLKASREQIIRNFNKVKNKLN